MYPAPPRFEGDVEDGAECLAESEPTHLAPDEITHLAAEFGAPGGGDAGLGREDDVAGSLHTGDRLVVEHRGHAQPRLLDEVPLNEVDLVGDPLRAGAAGGGQRRHLADAVTQYRLQHVGLQSIGPEDGLRHDAGQLLRLLLGGHLPQEEFSSYPRREGRVAKGVAVRHFGFSFPEPEVCAERGGEPGDRAGRRTVAARKDPPDMTVDHVDTAERAAMANTVAGRIPKPVTRVTGTYNR